MKMVGDEEKREAGLFSQAAVTHQIQRGVLFPGQNVTDGRSELYGAAASVANHSMSLA